MRKRSPHLKRVTRGGLSAFSATLESLLNALSSLLKIAVIAVFAVWVCLHEEFFEKWLWGLSGGEILGLKFTHESIDKVTADLEARISEGSQNGHGYKFDNAAVKSALVRASRVAPAIVDSRILWVDDKPDWNTTVVNLLREKLKIIVVPVNSTAEALDAMQVSPFDVIITNIWRPQDPENRQRKLSLCQVHYFDFLPNSSLANDFDKPNEIQGQGQDVAKLLALNRFNEDQNLHSPAGFGMADLILSKPGTSESRPEIIFFSAVNAEVARPFCGYRITNRIDVLLNSIVSILGERHAEVLARKPWETEKHTASDPEKTPPKN